MNAFASKDEASFRQQEGSPPGQTFDAGLESSSPSFDGWGPLSVYRAVL